jgi:predicted phage-related endonuclease
MKAIAFDTLEFAKRLRAAEFTEKQAETLAAAVAEIIESRLATKEDIALLQRDMKEMEVHLREDMALMQRDLRENMTLMQRDLKEDMVLMQRDLKELELRLKHDLTLRLGAMLAAGIGIIATLIKLL